MARTVKPKTGNAEPDVAADTLTQDVFGNDSVATPIPAQETAMPEPAASGPAEHEPQPATEPAPPLQTGRNAPEPARKYGFVPLFLGGIVAAIIGYAAAYWGQIGQRQDLTARLTAQSDSIAALTDQIAGLPDIAPLNTALTDLQTSLSTVQAETGQTLAALNDRLTAIEKAPNADGTLSETAIAAWEQDVAAMRAEIAAQQARTQDIVDAATAQLTQTRLATTTIEQSATQANAAANARAALARVQAAMDSGSPFDAALGDLAPSVAVPDALTALASQGVPTMLQLQTDFPDAARAALAVARNEGLAGEEGGGFATFLRGQFDVRSVIPLQGSSVDAILSRAEDALRQNRLTDSLAEVQSLPEVVRAEMAGWTGAAETRIAAIAAVEGLSQSLTSN